MGTDPGVCTIRAGGASQGSLFEGPRRGLSPREKHDTEEGAEGRFGDFVAWLRLKDRAIEEFHAVADLLDLSNLCASALYWDVSKTQ